METKIKKYHSVSAFSRIPLSFLDTSGDSAKKKENKGLFKT